MVADREQPAGALRRGLGKGVRDQEPPSNRFAHILDPARLIYRRADDGEVEPVLRADIAVQHIAKVPRIDTIFRDIYLPQW